MGLKAIGRDEAVSVLLERGEPRVLSNLRHAFPRFRLYCQGRGMKAGTPRAYSSN